MKNKTGKYIVIFYADNSECYINRYDTMEELEIAIKENNSGSPIIVCQELNFKFVKR
jgi:hypothetical protein